MGEEERGGPVSSGGSLLDGFKTGEASMRAPNPLGQGVEIALRLDHEICHGGSDFSGTSHLPARDENTGGGKRFPRFHLVMKSKGGKKMRTAKRCLYITDRDRPRQGRVDKTLHGGETVRPAGIETQSDFGPGQGTAGRRMLGVEMRLGGIKNRLQNRERIKRRHDQGNAGQNRRGIGGGLGLADGQKRAKRLRRGVFGWLDRQDRHGGAETQGLATTVSGAWGRGNRMAVSATLAPVSRSPQTRLSRQPPVAL